MSDRADRTDVLAQLGARLAGRYTLDREIGRGGMATVYLARDVRHERRVAVKVLDPELGATIGAERFLSEIRVTATLQHPNLLPLFDSGEADGLLFYVMPYVDGESLRARLTRERQLPVDEAVRITTSVAAALDYAHRHGVVHRDLKPENILLHDGQPLVADFGIALAVSRAGGTRVTQTGLSLGTPQYMSPEQATADRTIDARTDLYSLGAVAYEMLTGEPPHTGATSQAIIAKLLTEEPRPVTVLRRAVPPHVDSAIRCALEKLPADRFATASQFADALAGRGAVPATSRLGAGARSRTLSARRVAMVLGAVATLTAGLAGIALWRLAHVPAPVTMRFRIEAGEQSRIDYFGRGSVALAPDGRTIAYIAVGAGGRPMIHVRALDELRARELAGTDDIGDIHFSPDGRALVFFNYTASEVRTIAVGSGTVTTIAKVTNFRGLAWGNAADIVYVTRGAVWRVSPGGGAPRAVAVLDTVTARAVLYDPYVFPDGRTIACRVNVREGGRLLLAAMDSGAARITDIPISYPIGFANGMLIYSTAEAEIVAAAFDPRRGVLTGDPVQIIGAAGPEQRTGATATLSRTGTLAYLEGRGDQVVSVVDDHGRVTFSSPPMLEYRWPAFSPDGRRLAVTARPANGGDDIWQIDLASALMSRVTTDGGHNGTWSSDGKRLGYGRDPPGDGNTSLAWVAADNSGAPELLLTGVYHDLRFTPDGKSVLARLWGSRGNRDVVMFSLAGDRTPRPVLTTPFSEGLPTLSPDGRWMAYESNDRGEKEVYVRTLAPGGGRVQVSLGGGTEPRWSRDGTRIFYRTPQVMHAARVTIGPTTVTVTARDSLFSNSYQSTNTGGQEYDVHPDGRHFAVIRDGPSRVGLVVVANWLTELRARIR